LREIDIINEASTLRDARLAWQQAQYARFAFHSPNKMPECPSGQAQQSNDEADAVYVRAWMKAMHNSSRTKNGR
jgi:hypothetical protein